LERILSGSEKRGALEIDKKIDIYAYSIIVYECAFQRNPYPNMKNREIVECLRAGKRPSLDASSLVQGIREIASDSNLLQLITCCWRENPQERPSTGEIIDHFFTKESRFSPSTDFISHSITFGNSSITSKEFIQKDRST
jgi:serine/threonine protein kinase